MGRSTPSFLVSGSVRFLCLRLGLDLPSESLYPRFPASLKVAMGDLGKETGGCHVWGRVFIWQD